MAASYLRDWPRCTSLVPNTLGDVGDWLVLTLDWIPIGRCSDRSVTVVVARRPRCPAGGRFWHGVAADAYAFSYYLYLVGCTGIGKYCYHRGESIGSR